MIMNRRKSLTFFTIAVMALVLAVMVFSLPFNYSVYASVTDFETFDSAFSAMMKKYNNESVVSASSVSEESVNSKGYCDTRLIVNSNSKINTMGAEMWCGVNDTFILQYTDSTIAAKAYEYYQKQNLNVYYDLVVSVNDYEVEEVHTDGIFDASSNSTSYNSWGWGSANDYMGVNTYISSLNAYSGSYNDIVVAVLDTGINTSHTLFSDRIKVVDTYYQGYQSTRSYEDDNGHGTHVSGTIAEITAGYNVKIMPFKVLDSSGNGTSTYIIRALNYLITAKENSSLDNLKVVNMSLGITSSSVPEGSASAYATNISGCINTLYSDGVLSVVSAGNENANTYNIQPANVANAITVSALSVDGAAENRTYTNEKANIKGTKLLKATYSNYGDAVDFAAPGTWILSAYIGGSSASAYLSGTSMAAPHVAACVALYYVHPSHTSDDVGDFVVELEKNANKNCLVSSGAYALNGDPNNKFYGYGCLNIADLGIDIVGNVSFSDTTKLHYSNFSVTISYSEAIASGETLKIYYTFDEKLDESSSLDISQMFEYTTAISITKSRKITAVAYVYNSSNNVVRRSYQKSFTYYLNDMDIEYNYDFSGGVITSYKGVDPDLTKLVVPQKIGGVTVTTIGTGAFAPTCYVEELTLPSTITKINDKAFYQQYKTNTNLKNVTFTGSEIAIGAHAFRACSNLKYFEIDNITSLGDYALYGTKIESIELFKTKTIGTYAFRQSKITKIYFGKYLTEIGDHGDNRTFSMNGGTVYGYNDLAESFANSHDANYHNMEFEIVRNLPNKKYVDLSSENSVSYTVEVNGANVSVLSVLGDLYSKTTVLKDATESVGEKNVFNVSVDFSGLSNAQKIAFTSGTVKIRFKDIYSDSIDTASSQLINAYGKNSYSVDDVFGSKFNYSIVYVNGEIIDNTYKFYENITYTIKIDAPDGCVVKNITISGNSVKINEEEDVTIHASDFHDGEYDGISYDAEESGEFELTFMCDYGTVYVDGTKIIGSKQANRDDTITFTIENEIGYRVVRVNVNSTILLAVDGVYTISNIRTNKFVDIIFEPAYYSVDISYVASCASYIGDFSKIAYGTKNLEITLTTVNGYVIDFVTVDGKTVEVKNGTFVIDEVKDDVDVVVSFRQTKSIFSGENSTILYYFIVFAVLFVIFILGRVALHLLRKHQAKQEQK